MKFFSKKLRNYLKTLPGFVLPFTLLICAIMLLISVSISTILIKQIYFSNIERDSQVAYYAADNAIACALSIDETYSDARGIGLFPYDVASSSEEATKYVDSVLKEIKERRAAFKPPMSVVAGDRTEIKCAQSFMLNSLPSPSDFKTNDGVIFSHTFPAHDSVPETTETGKSSSFLMQMDLDGGTTFRCAKVTVNKTLSYRQIIAQGYSRCDVPEGRIERAVINTTLMQ